MPFAFLDFGLGVGFGSLIAIVAVLVLIFEVWMIVDAITNDRITTKAKVLWVVGMFLIHPIVAIIYYFTDRKKRA